MDEMDETAQQAKHMFFEIDEVYKLVMNKMHEIYCEIVQIAAWFTCLFCRFIAKFECKYSRICVASLVRAQTLLY